MVETKEFYPVFPDPVKDFIKQITLSLNQRNVIIGIPVNVLKAVNDCAANGNGETFPIALEVKSVDSNTAFDHLLRIKPRETLTKIAFLIPIQQGIWHNRWIHFNQPVEEISRFIETISSDDYKLFDPDNQVVDIPSELKHCIDLIELTAKAEGKPFGYIATIIPG